MKLGDPRHMGQILRNMALIELNRENLESSINLMKKVIEVDKQISSPYLSEDLQALTTAQQMFTAIQRNKQRPF